MSKLFYAAGFLQTIICVVVVKVLLSEDHTQLADVVGGKRSKFLITDSADGVPPVKTKVTCFFFVDFF